MRRTGYLILLLVTGYLAAIYEYPAVLVLFVTELLLLAFLLVTAVSFYFTCSAEPTARTYMVFRNTQGGLAVRIHKKGFLPVGRIHLRTEEGEPEEKYPEEYDYFSVAKPGNLYLKIHVDTEHCGIVLVRLRFLRVYDYLSLFSFQKKLTKTVRVYVMPEQKEIRLPLDALTLWDRQERLPQALQVKGEDEFMQLREYQDGDTLRRIDWKSSARLDDYMVREYAPEKETVLEVLLDTTGFATVSQEELDCFYELVFGVVRGLLETVPTVQILWFDNRTRQTQTMAVRDPEELLLLFAQMYETDLTIPKEEQWQFKSRKRNPGELHRDWITIDLSGRVSLNGERISGTEQ